MQVVGTVYFRLGVCASRPERTNTRFVRREERGKKSVDPREGTETLISWAWAFWNNHVGLKKRARTSSTSRCKTNAERKITREKGEALIQCQSGVLVHCARGYPSLKNLRPDPRSFRSQFRSPPFFIPPLSPRARSLSTKTGTCNFLPSFFSVSKIYTCVLSNVPCLILIFHQSEDAHPAVFHHWKVKLKHDISARKNLILQSVEHQITFCSDRFNQS